MAVNTTEIRDQIVADLGLAGAENIYTEDPRLTDWDAVVSFLRQSDEQYVQAWVVRRIASDPHTSETDFGRVPIGCAVFWWHTYSIMMFFGYVENVSEDAMQGLIDSVLTYFQTRRTLGETVFGIRKPLALTQMEPRELGGLAGMECTFTLTVEDHELGLTPV